jgi:MFS family permease
MDHSHVVRKRQVVRVLFAATVGMTFGMPAIGIASFSAFVGPLSRAFGWGRGDISVAFTIMTCVMIVSSPLAGALIDKFGVRRVLLPSIALFGLCLIGFSVLTAYIWHLYLMYALLAVVGAATTPVSYSRPIISWFDDHRGLALSIMLAGIGLGTAIAPPLVHVFDTYASWRGAYALLGCLVLIIPLPATYCWLHEPTSLPTASAFPMTSAFGAGSNGNGIALRNALTSRPFIGMFVGFMLAGMVTSGFMSQLVPLLIDRGLTAAAAAGIASSLGLALIVGRLFTGFLLDRFYAPAVVVSLLCCPVVGLLIINGVGSEGWVFAAPVLIGLGMGAEMDFMSYLTSRYFPASLFGRIYGLLYTAILIGISVGSLIMGYGQQLTGSYDLPLRIMLAASICGLLPFALLGPYPADDGGRQPYAKRAEVAEGGAIGSPAGE